MAFCSNCGSEIQEGMKFCSNCGTPVGGNNTSAPQQTYYQQVQPVKEPETGLNKYGKFFGIILLILSIVDFVSDPPLLTIIFSVAIIAGTIFCLIKKYKWKGFQIAALILAVYCLFAGVTQSKKFGLLKTPTKEEYFAANNAKQDTIGSGEDKADVSSKSVESAEKKTEPKKGGVDPDLKAFLDSYEQFVDEYVDFMKKYMNDDPMNALSMMGEYVEIMEKYEDFAETVDRYDSDNMSTEDAKYYLEVTSRCTQKMLDIYSD